MDTPETPSAPTVESPNELAELKSAYASLVIVLRAVLVGLIVFGLSVTALLYRQVSSLSEQLQAGRAVEQRMAESDQTEQSNLIHFMGKLQEFARLNPDFQPLYQKYANAMAAPDASAAKPPAK